MDFSTDERKNTSDIQVFRAFVAEVALAGASRHGWCAEINQILDRDLGLIDFIPATYHTEYKDGGTSSWYHYDTHGAGEAGKKAALEAAALRMAGNHRAGRNRDGALPTHAEFRTTLYVTSDEAALEAEITRMRNDFGRLKEAYVVLMNVESQKQYAPLDRNTKTEYRVVGKKSDEVVETIELTDDEVIKAGLEAGYTFATVTPALASA